MLTVTFNMENGINYGVYGYICIICIDFEPVIWDIVFKTEVLSLLHSCENTLLLLSHHQNTPLPLHIYGLSPPLPYHKVWDSPLTRTQYDTHKNIKWGVIHKHPNISEHPQSHGGP